MGKILTVLLVVGLFVGCNKKQNDIDIGMVLGLSGKYSSLGSTISDGVHLAFGNIDYNINGSQINLIERDDAQDKQTDIKIIKEFIQRNIKIIIGNVTSSMTKVSLEVLKSRPDILLFSPTASSGEFSNIDDNFLRSNVGNSKTIYKNSVEFIKKQGWNHPVIIGDSNNKAFLHSYTKLFASVLKEEQIIHNDIPYIDSNENLKVIYDKIKQLKSNDLIILVSNSVDSSKIIQYLRINKIDTPIICSGWANDNTFFQNVGRYSEGIYFISSKLDMDTAKQFEQEFIKAYGTKPDRFAKKGYVAANIIIKALKTNGDVSKLKETILKIKEFDTIVGKVIFTKYGDILEHPQYVYQVTNGKLLKISDE